jgi:hypothetical protein
MRSKLLGGFVLTCGFAVLSAACNKAASPAAPSGSAVVGGGVASGGSEQLGASAGSEVYMADLKPLNSHVGYRAVTGNAKFMLRNGEFVAMDNATGLQPGMIHPQHIHAAAAAGSRCER